MPVKSTTQKKWTNSYKSKLSKTKPKEIENINRSITSNKMNYN